MPPLNSSTDFQDDQASFRVRREAALARQNRKIKRQKVAKEIAGIWIWCWIIYAVGIFLLGSAEFDSYGFLFLATTLPIFVGAAVYASPPARPSGWDAPRK